MADRSEEKRKKASLLKRLTNKYRLVILNDDTFEEVTSFRLSRINVYILLSTIAVILVSITISALVYTPLNVYFMGSGDIDQRKNLITLRLKSDSLDHVAKANDLYLTNLRRIINGDAPISQAMDTVVVSDQQKYDSLNLENISPSEANFRNQVEQEQKFSVSGNKTEPAVSRSTIRGIYFFTPLKGYITQDFDTKDKHYGVDIVAPENEPIKATLDGIVVFADWTAETGYVMAIQHAGNLISLYKHNSVLLKNEGDYVKAGDVIAIVGNTGELSSGPHLHFELWYNGIPLNPKDYIAFN